MSGLRNFPSSVRKLAYAACAGAVVAASASAQPAAVSPNQVDRRIERAIRSTQADPNFRLRIDPTLSISERSYFEFGGNFTFSVLHLVDANDDSRRLVQPEFQFFGRAIIDNAHSFFVRSRFQYRAYSNGDSFDGHGDQWEEPFLDRYWYEFNLGRAVEAETGITPENNFSFRIGRQFVDWGQGLALSEQLYAVRAQAQFGKVTVTGLAGVTPSDESVTDFDASRDEFDHNNERAFFGGEIRYTALDDKQFYFYYLRMADWNSDGRAAAPLLAPIPIEYDYDANYFGWGLEGTLGGKLAYEGEFVYESGRSTSDPIRSPFVGGTPVQTREDISAWAARGQLTYFLGDERRTRFEFETILASGDGDRNIATDTVAGNKPGSDDLAFNSLGFANTGLAFSPSLSNVMIFRLGASTFPFTNSEYFRNFQIGGDLFIHNKFQGTAPIDELTTNDNYLGFETDFSLNWRITSDLAVTGRYGVFVPGDAIISDGHFRQFLFVGATLSF